jgi:hypothetical protein
MLVKDGDDDDDDDDDGGDGSQTTTTPRVTATATTFKTTGQSLGSLRRQHLGRLSLLLSA